MPPQATPQAWVARAELSAPGQTRFDWRHPDARRAQSAAARRALEQAARAAGAPTGPWDTHEAGGLAPRRAPDGRRWDASLTHARGQTAAALAHSGPIGVDLERCDRAQPRHVGDKLAELGAELAPLQNPDALLSLWTRVEALLKRERVGLAGWSRIEVPRVCPPTGEATLQFDGAPRWTHVELAGECWLALAAEFAHVPVMLDPPPPTVLPPATPLPTITPPSNQRPPRPSGDANASSAPGR